MESDLDYFNNTEAMIADPATDSSPEDRLCGPFGIGMSRTSKYSQSKLDRKLTDRAKLCPCKETKLLKPGKKSDSEDHALRLYGLHQSIPPYHLEGPEKNMCWISGKTVTQTEVFSEENEDNTEKMPPFSYLTLEEVRKLQIGDRIDYCDDDCRFIQVEVVEMDRFNLVMNRMDDIRCRKSEICCSLQGDDDLGRFASLGSFTNRRAHRMKHLKIGDMVDCVFDPKHEGSDFIRSIAGEVVDRQIGQVQIRVRKKQIGHRAPTRELYWRHLDMFFGNHAIVQPWPAMYSHDPLIHTHGDGHWKCGDIVEYQTKNMEFMDTAIFVLPGRSKGFVTAVLNQYPLKLKVWDGEMVRELCSNDFHFRRVPQRILSPLRYLFYVKKTAESSLMAWTLKNILGDGFDWLTVNIIAEYLPLNHQRDVYFDTSRFEQVVKIQDNPHSRNDEILSELATALKVDDRLENCHLSNVEQHPAFDEEFEESMVKWQNVHRIKDGWTGFYQRMIFDVARKGHPTFPQDPHVNDKKSTPRHQMYAEKPYLPLINEEGRSNLKLVSNRIDIALKPTTKLYGYQLHTVLWCHELERSILAKQSLCVGSNDLRFCFDAGMGCAVYCIKKRTTNNPKPTLTQKHRDDEREVPELEMRANVDEHLEYEYIPADVPRVIPPRVITYRGGIIADAGGLGKTLTMLSLMAAHPFGDDITRNCFHGQSADLQYGPKGQTILCAATLVAVPSHLIQKWNAEIQHHFKDHLLNVVVISTEADHQKLTCSDVLRANVVLVSASFLRGPQCVSFNFHCGSGRPQYGSKTSKQENFNRSIQAPSLELFHWRRVVIDEGHQLLADDQVRAHLLRINSDFRWYCTATPFPTDASIEYAAKFLDIRLNGHLIKWSEELNKPLGSVLHNVLYHHLYSRHTEESISSSLHHSNIQEICLKMDLHPIERMLYDITKMRRDTPMADVMLERKICAGNLRDFEQRLYLTWKRKQDRAQWLREILKACFSPLEIQSEDEKCPWDEEDEDPMNPVFFDNYLQKLMLINRYHFSKITETFERKILNIKKELKNLFRERAVRNRQLKRSEWTQRQERILKQIALVIYTRKNIFQKLKSQMSFYRLQFDRVHDIGIEQQIEVYEEQFRTAGDGEKLLKILRKFGSKQALLLQFVLEKLGNPNNRIIIFSLFGRLLKILKDRLKMVGVEAEVGGDNGDAEGNRVKLLSNKNAMIDTDLHSVTHFILVDPIPGSQSKSFFAENHAIQRARRHGMGRSSTATKVLRFVAQNTIEQEIHERNELLREQTKINRNNVQLGNRTQDEINFYLNIKTCTHQPIGIKRKRKDKENMGNADDEHELFDQSESPNKKRRLSIQE